MTILAHNVIEFEIHLTGKSGVYL